jgi:hypothetical protein
MSDHPVLSPDEFKRRAEQIREAMSRMSGNELCDLLRDLQKKMREAAKSPGKP